MNVEIVIGDARKTVPDWNGRADAWFLDGFAPTRNPELWGKELLAEIAKHTVSGGTFSTFTAAGQVRRNLRDVGFVPERISGYGKKRHMTRGWLR